MVFSLVFYNVFCASDYNAEENLVFSLVFYYITMLNSIARDCWRVSPYCVRLSFSVAFYKFKLMLVIHFIQIVIDWFKFIFSDSFWWILLDPKSGFTLGGLQLIRHWNLHQNVNSGFWNGWKWMLVHGLSNSRTLP